MNPMRNSPPSAAVGSVHLLTGMRKILKIATQIAAYVRISRSSISWLLDPSDARARRRDLAAVQLRRIAALSLRPARSRHAAFPNRDRGGRALPRSKGTAKGRAA